MIHLRDGRFSLSYDLIADKGKMFFDRELLIAEWADLGWNIIHGPGWFELRHYHRSSGGSRFEGHDLRSRLNHIRALYGYQTTYGEPLFDPSAHAHRYIELRVLQGWDKWWRDDREKFLKESAA